MICLVFERITLAAIEIRLSGGKMMEGERPLRKLLRSSK